MKRAAFTLAGVAMALAVPASAADPITGRWITEDRDAVITIAPRSPQSSLSSSSMPAAEPTMQRKVPIWLTSMIFL